MDDIVKRLATAKNLLELEKAASDAIDEIEKLRIDVTVTNATAMGFYEEIKQLRNLLRDCWTHDRTGTDPEVWIRVRRAIGDE